MYQIETIPTRDFIGQNPIPIQSYVRYIQVIYSYTKYMLLFLYRRKLQSAILIIRLHAGSKTTICTRLDSSESGRRTQRYLAGELVPAYSGSRIRELVKFGARLVCILLKVGVANSCASLLGLKAAHRWLFGGVIFLQYCDFVVCDGTRSWQCML